jgi:hypothetical protein
MRYFKLYSHLRNWPMTFLSVTKEYIGSSELEVKRKKGGI